MKNKLFKKSVIAIALLLPLSVQSLADNIHINFDNVSSGSLANSAAPTGIHFYQAQLVNDTDEFGSEILHTEKWQVDTLNDAATPVVVENPLNYGYGNAPTGKNALNALWQPVLMHFDSLKNLANFSVTIDNSHFGEIGTSWLYFLGASKEVLDQVAFDQTISGATIGFNHRLDNIQDVVFSSGAFYDKIEFTQLPTPTTLPLLLTGLMVVFARRKRA